MKGLILKGYQFLRILFFYLMSENKKIFRLKNIKQPVIFMGKGKITIAKTVKIGVKTSPVFLSTYGYIEARNNLSKVVIGERVWINNNVSIVSEGEGIIIGDDTLIGHDVEIIDSDFHDLDPGKRMGGKAKTARVEIGKNVFIGNNVKIGKGVKIGENSVIGLGSVVFSSIPPDSIVAGNPAKVIKNIGYK